MWMAIMRESRASSEDHLPRPGALGSTAEDIGPVTRLPDRRLVEQPPELQLLYDTAPIGLAFLSRDCRYVQINRHLTEICGISVDEHIGRSVRETVPSVADQVEKIVELILSKGEPITGIEVNGQRPDGTNADRFWRTNWHPLRGPEGTIVGINVVAEEITENKRAEAALAASEARYRALVRASSSLVWTTAADGQIVDMPEWRALTGQTVDEVRGWGWLTALHPDDRGRTQVIWQAAVDARSIYETEYRIRRWDGEYVWHQARGVAVLEDDGSIREWVGICVDIEDRKRATQQQIEAEKALRDLNETLEQRVEAEARERARIWNVSQDLLVVADSEGKFLNVNPAWTATLGWSEADLVGNTSEWLLHPEDREKTRAETARLGEGRRTLRFENRLRHKGGSYCRLSWRAVPDRGLIYAVARDITELKNAEEQLRTLHQELAKVSRQTTMGAMTASIAHEVNQPLASIVANANAGLRWLTRAEPDLDEARATLNRIIKDGHRASEVIATIRSMFGKDRRERRAVSVNELVGDVLVLVHGELESHHISLQNEMFRALPHIMAERVQLQQVFLNLIMNAVDAMSSVTDRARVLTIKSRICESDRVLITLEDSGTGIDPSHMDRIFDAFFTTKSDGMGMGLSICRSIIESHGGTLQASANNPYGTIVHVALPLTA
jgi:PAS domain S-box-containing protein